MKRVETSHPLASLGRSMYAFTQRFIQHHAAIGVAVILFLSIFAFPSKIMAAQSGGRIGGGSFRSSDRQRYSTTRMAPTRTRTSLWDDGMRRPSSSTTILVNPYPFSYSLNPFVRSPIYYGGGAGAVVLAPPSPLEVLVIGGALYFMVQGLFKTPSNSWSKEPIESVLGTGISVAKLSVALQVPNRDDPNSILNVLNRLANTANTDSQAGVQTLTHQIALEILRRRQSIVASSTSYKHFDDVSDAQREYNKMSVQERSKFERETGKINFCIS
jgi:uncharacterized membrane protein